MPSFNLPIKQAPLSHLLLKRKTKHALVPPHCSAYCGGLSGICQINIYVPLGWGPPRQPWRWAGTAQDQDQDQAELGSNPSCPLPVILDKPLPSGFQNLPLGKMGINTCPLLGRPQGILVTPTG